MRDAVSTAAETASNTGSLLLGCGLGLAALFGVTVVLALIGASIWWLVPVSFFANLVFGGRLINTYNILRFGRGHVVSRVFWALAVPTAIMFLLQWGVYALTRSLAG